MVMVLKEGMMLSKTQMWPAIYNKQNREINKELVLLTFVMLEHK